MSYDPFDYGDQLNPEKLNNKLEQINKLLSRAYVHNNELRKRVETLNIAFSLANEDLAGATIGTSTGYTEASVGASGHEVIIGGKHFSADYTSTSVTVIDTNNTQDDNYSLILSNTDTVSRIPLTLNLFNELEPSLGTILTSSLDDFDQTKLWTMLSPSAVWADTSASATGTIYIEVPATLTPLLNRITIKPITGTGYKLQYEDFGGVYHFVDPTMSNGYHTGMNTYHIDGSKFSGVLEVILNGTNISSSYHYGLSTINMDYRKYVSTGDATIDLALTSSVAKNLTYVNANFEDSNDVAAENAIIRISAGATGVAFDDNIIYDSTYHQYPLLTSSYPLEDHSNTIVNTVYIKVTLKQKTENTPALKDLTIRYEEV